MAALYTPKTRRLVFSLISFLLFSSGPRHRIPGGSPMQPVRCLLALVLCSCASPALAQRLGIAELRGGLMIDDVELVSQAPFWTVPHFETISLSNLDTVAFDVLFTSPEVDAFRWIGAPRPVLGLDLNLRHESMVHASFNWHLPVGNTGFFAEAELGGALHNGMLTGATPPLRNLGCRALFYWSVNLGYQIDENWSVMATEQHASQFGLCGWTVNQGINYEGIRVGYKF